MTTHKKRKDVYYHHRIGPISRVEREFEKSKPAEYLGKFGDHVKNRVKNVATVSTGMAALGTLGAVAGLASHFASGGPTPPTHPEFRDAYFFHPDPIPMESVNMKSRELIDLIGSNASEAVLNELSDELIKEHIVQLLQNKRKQIAESLLKDGK